MKDKILLVGSEGYIGSYLYAAMKDTFDIDRCDIGKRGIVVPGVGYNMSYNVLDCFDLDIYDQVLWFAGHSSVGAAEADPLGALSNNCTDLVELRKRMNPYAQLVYASSASVYPLGAPAFTHEDYATPPASGPYDQSKFAFDYIAKAFLKKTIGLRLGTVAGWSPNLRRDTVFNAMNLSAMENGIVRVSSYGAMRSILFLPDLLEAVLRIMQRPRLETGVFNLASMDTKIGELGEYISGYHDSTLSVSLDRSTKYSFVLDTRKAEDVLGLKRREKYYDEEMHDACAHFKQRYISNKKEAA